MDSSVKELCFLYTNNIVLTNKDGEERVSFLEKANISFFISRERWSVSLLHNNVTCYEKV